MSDLFIAKQFPLTGSADSGASITYGPEWHTVPGVIRETAPRYECGDIGHEYRQGKRQFDGYLFCECCGDVREFKLEEPKE
jgi:hypothetical protein